MLRKLTTVSLLLLLVASVAQAHGNLKLINGRWFDGTKFVARTMYSVDNVFRSTYTGEARTIDLAGKYVVPPFGDAHNHAFADGAPFDEQLQRFLRAGVFYVKNPNNTAALTAPIRARVNKPETVDVIYANAGLTATGGHPSQLYGPARADQSYFVVDSLADLERKWPLVLGGKPDFIKVYLEYSEDPKRNRGLSAKLVRPIVERAHAAKLTVSAHVASTADVHEAIAAGIDEITHLPLQPIDPADAALAAKKKVTFVTTVLSHRATDGDPMPTHRANLALLERAGVQVLLGVDNEPLVVDEAEAVRKLGVYDARELLTMLTTTTPRAIFPKRKFARLADGYEASFLALDANPLDDFSAIRRISTRVKQGHVIEVAPLKRSVAEALIPVVLQGGATAAIAEYKRLKASEPEAWDYGEARVNQLGYALLQHNKIDDAIAIFRFNTELFPKSANTWDSLGEAYARANDREQAIANYRKSLELNPHNKNAEEALRKLAAEP